MSSDSSFSRREFLSRTAFGAMTLAGCGVLEPKKSSSTSTGPQPSQLLARPIASPATPRTAMTPGLRTLDGTTTETLLYVPTGYMPDKPTALAVALHGAGQTARTGITPLMAHADASGIVLVAPQATGTTWDFIWGPYGPDVAALDKTLGRVFRDFAVDASRVSLTGFSDGASYALSLGLTNGDLFTRLVAFSPGILAPAAHRGKPAIYVSHGTRDGILNIDRSSRRFVPELRGDGYTVTYHEFDGPHTVPADIAAEAAAFVANH